MADLPTLRAKVEAAQALAVKATPGPWAIDERVRCAAIVSPSRVDSPGLGRSYAGVLAFWYPSHRWQHEHADDPLAVWDAPLGDMAMMAAAPDLVTYLTDALALAESQASELTAIRVALGNGADEAAWPPGLTLAEAVGRLRELVNMASGFEISEPTVAARSLGGVRVERCGQLEGPDLWAVRHRGNVLGRDGHWAYEPIPSSRDDAFMAEYRFASRDEAIKAGRAAIAGAQ